MEHKLTIHVHHTCMYLVPHYIHIQYACMYTTLQHVVINRRVGVTEVMRSCMGVLWSDAAASGAAAARHCGEDC